MATDPVTEREGDTEVSRGHSTEPKGEGRAEHVGTRYRREVREQLKAENTNIQLAFRWEGEGEAQAMPSEGSMLTSAPTEPGTLAEGLMEAVVAAENVRQALGRVRANKGAPGVDGMTVEELPEHLKVEWPRLKQELLEGEYKPQAVKRVEIPKPDGGVRQLGIPTVVDRLIQQAVLQVLSPLYDPTFSNWSYGFRPKRNAHQAVSQAREYIEQGNSWVVDIDLEKFFDRVNHDMLMGPLAKRIGDKRLLKLIRRYLQAGIMSEGVVVNRLEGTPQGGPLSPLLANVLLDDLDRELDRRGHKFCRYADDCNIYVRTQRAGERVMVSVTRYLEGKLRLRVNAAKSRVARPSKRDFLGFRMLGRSKSRVIIAPSSRRRMKDAVRRITRRNRGVSLDCVLAELGRYTDGWVGYYRLAQTPSVYAEFDEWIRHRLRCYQWKQWKRPATRARALRSAGVGRYLAFGTAYDGPGLWRAAGSPGLTKALPNAKLARMGYHSMHERYLALTST
jgi:RNA-directed DNA polymerase